ncbi:protein FAM214B-like isoform X1 [Arapaima gigas]
MRHIHVEISHKEASSDHPAQEGDLPSSHGMMVGVNSVARQELRGPFGEDKIKLQKVYQLSIFSQMGGFSDLPKGGRLQRHELKRSLEEQPQNHKRPHLDEGSCPGPMQEYAPRSEVLDGEMLCNSGQHFCHVGTHVVEHTDGIPVQNSSPAQVKCYSQDNQNGHVPRAQSPPFPKPEFPANFKMVNPTQHKDSAPLAYVLKTTPTLAVTTPDDVLRPLSTEDCSNGASLWELSRSPKPTDQPLGDGNHSNALRSSSLEDVSSNMSRTADSRDGQLSLESAPLKYSSIPITPSTSTTSLPGSSSALSSISTYCAKKKLLSSSDTGESCSEDEGPSTSKRSRLALQAPGLCLGAFRSTDAKGAPFWNHLLPCAREQPRSPNNCSRAGRRLKNGIRLKSRQLRSGQRGEPCISTRPGWPSVSISRSLLGSFEESMLKGRFSPSGRIEGFTAEIGASGSYCPQHATLPVEVTYYDISEHSAPSPFLGVIYLEPLGKKGYSVPKAGTIQVTLFNPNKTVVKMFLVTYNFGDMPVNHMTFLRHRIFLVPVEEEEEEEEEEEGQRCGPQMNALDRKKILCYLIHLRFQSSKSGKIYLHNDIRLLFSRKSIEVDTGIPYELKSFTESWAICTRASQKRRNEEEVEQKNPGRWVDMVKSRGERCC